MANEILEKIANDEDLANEFFVKYYEEIMSDDEPCYKKFRRLYQTYKEHQQVVDDILMTLCGWTMESLARKALGQEE